MATDRIRECFAFRTEKILPGDILLCTGKGAISVAIKWVAWGNFSHAAICTRSPLFIEADFPGVSHISLQRMLLAERKNARVLRLKRKIPDRFALAAAAALRAASYETGTYDKVAAVLSPYGGGAPTGSGIFCSFLAATAYQEAGLNISRGNHSPAATTPADIEFSDKFDNITDDVLETVTLGPTGTYYFLDRVAQHPAGQVATSEAKTPAQLYNEALTEATRRVSAFLVAKGVCAVKYYPEAVASLFKNAEAPWFNELDELFASTIRELGLPEVEEGALLVAEARQRDVLILAGSLQSSRILFESFEQRLNEALRRIRTTIDLQEERRETIAVLEAGQAQQGWKYFDAALECERLILDTYDKNYAMHEAQLKMLADYAKSRGWDAEVVGL